MNIADKTLNCLKAITVQSVTNAGSGHIGSSLGASAIMLALFKDHLNFDVSETDYLNRDRFVLSSGHLSPLYYTTLSMFGYDVTLQDLKNLRKPHSRTPGHPEYGVTDGVEVSTGPLGQGIANAVGMAIAESLLEERFNSVGFSIINNYTYCLCSDGDLMEGVAMESCSMAGSLCLKRLILLYDSNEVTSDGVLSLSNRENVAKKFKAMGWNVVRCKHGNNYYACSRAIGKAKHSLKPTIVIFDTTIGIGTEKEGTSAIHNYILSKEELAVFNQKLGVIDNFYIPSDVRDWCIASTRQGKLNHEKWNQQLAIYSNSNPDLYRQFMQFFDRRKFDGEKFAKNAYKWANLSGREVNKIILNEIASKMLQMVGGSADLLSSTMTNIESASNFLAGNRRGRNIHFGTRESAMAAICNGIALYESFIPFCSTFLGFSNYMFPEIRMSAMMNLSVLYTFTHDSIAIGPDGPSHQPIEQLGQLRSIIGLNVFRPCCPQELVAAYDYLISGEGPLALVLSKGPMIDNENASYKGALAGGYILEPAQKQADIVIYATGSEVELAIQTAEELKKKYAVSVVSMPCLELFEKQSQAYKTKVLQPEAKLKIVIEPSNDATWYKYLTANDLFINVDHYMYSGDGKTVYEDAGFTVKEIVKKIQKVFVKK